ncbi:MAG: hypothetical protein ACPGJS_03590 [Flammeovirgaceae bacterium]
MTPIKNIEGLSPDDITRALSLGGKFVIYQYCISIIFMTFKYNSEIHFVKSRQTGIIQGLKFTLLTLLLGWWGIPRGPIYTINSIFNNLTGGVDVTQEVVDQLNVQLAG